MTSQRQRRFLLPGDPGWHGSLSSHDVVEQPVTDESSRQPSSMTCTDCGVQLSVPAGASGKKTTCPACGTLLSYPGSNGKPGSAAVLAPIDTNLLHPVVDPVSEPPKQVTAFPRATNIPQIRIGCIGRGNAGKTALFHALDDGLVGDFLPSRLHIDAGDPRDVAQMIHEAEQTYRMLHSAGIPPTEVASQMRYCLYEGGHERAVFQLHEVIGQVLTHTMPNSTPEIQARYDEYVARLVSAEVLWAVVPCPPTNPGRQERRRYSNDLRITLAYLREAIRQRSQEGPIAVAVVLSKIDTLFPSAGEAQSALTDSILRNALGPLVDFIQTSDRVKEAAVIPVTAFGFGTAMVKAGIDSRGGSPILPDDLFASEPVWVVREGVDPAPFNLDALFLWTLLYGMRGQEQAGTPEQNRQRQLVSDKLQSDLELASPWIVPLK